MSTHRSPAYLCYDPRDPAQCIADRATWRHTDNAILISATMLLVAQGETYPIRWDKVAALADLCEDPEFLLPEDSPLRPFATRDETDAMLRAAIGRRIRPAAEA